MVRKFYPYLKLNLTDSESIKPKYKFYSKANDSATIVNFPPNSNQSKTNILPIAN